MENQKVKLDRDKLLDWLIFDYSLFLQNKERQMYEAEEFEVASRFHIKKMAIMKVVEEIQSGKYDIA